MAWSIALASGWSIHAAHAEEVDDQQAGGPAGTGMVARGPANAARDTTAPGGVVAFGDVWGVRTDAERQARAIASDEGMSVRRSGGTGAGNLPTPAPSREAPRTDVAPGPTGEAQQIQQRALSTLALHAARAMGSETARMVGLDAIEPVVAMNESSDTGSVRPAVFQAATPRGRLGARGTASARRPHHADLVSFQPARSLASAYDDMIDEVAREHAVAPHLVRAVIKVESNFEAGARSPKGAIGLMQVMPATGRRFGASDLKDPRDNLGAGTRYLRWLLNRFDQDLTLAVAAYNAGEGAVEKYGRQVPPYPETQNYVRKVLAHLGMPGGGADGNGSPTGDRNSVARRNTRDDTTGDTRDDTRDHTTDDTTDDTTETAKNSATDNATGATPARRSPGAPLRAASSADRAAASRQADAALRSVSGWFGAILTSGSATGKRLSAAGTAEGAQATAWQDSGVPDSQTPGKPWPDGRTAAQPHPADWHEWDADRSRSRGPV